MTSTSRLARSLGRGTSRIIVFGSLMGAAFVSQQFLQNVLSYSTLGAGAAFLPTIIFMVLVAPRSAKLIETRGARFTLLCGYVFLLAFATMLLLWEPGIPYWKIGLAYAFIGIGVGFAGTPASHSLTGSVPVRRAGMASGTADLQRDLGGAIMQSIFDILTAGYAAATTAAIAAAPNSQQINDSVQSDCHEVVPPAKSVARQYPAVRRPDHGRGETVVPERRPVGVHGRHRRGPARRGARVVPLPEAGRRATTAGRLGAQDAAPPEHRTLTPA